MPSEKSLDVASIGQLIIAGWTGRNVAALEAHIRELEAIGVARPKSTPVFYRVAAALLTTAPSIEVIGDTSSGEVEFVLYAMEDGLWLGVGSDHTDRKAETMGVTLSKQMCAKPVGAQLWRYDEVAPHWDRLILRAQVTTNGKTRLYQEGALTAMRTPEDLIGLYAGGKSLPRGAAMFCGTFAVHGAIEPGDRFAMELEDPILGRRLMHAYDILQLPIEG